MKHYKAINAIHIRISELQVEIYRLKSLPDDSENYAGHVFIKNDINNFNKEIQELTESMNFLIQEK